MRLMLVEMLMELGQLEPYLMSKEMCSMFKELVLYCNIMIVVLQIPNNMEHWHSLAIMNGMELV